MNQHKAKGIEPSYKWLEVFGDEDYAKGVFLSLHSLSLASSSSTDQFVVEYVSEDDASSVPQCQTAPEDQVPPPPPPS